MKKAEDKFYYVEVLYKLFYKLGESMVNREKRIRKEPPFSLEIVLPESVLQSAEWPYRDREEEYGK
jgi:hypothetical protein